MSLLRLDHHLIEDRLPPFKLMHTRSLLLKKCIKDQRLSDTVAQKFASVLQLIHKM